MTTSVYSANWKKLISVEIYSNTFHQRCVYYAMRNQSNKMTVSSTRQIIRNINTLRPRQNERHFTDDTFKRIFLKENVRISIKISLKFVPMSPIDNIPALFQIMAWRRPGDKPLSEPMMVNLPTHICVTRPQWVKLVLGYGSYVYIHTQTYTYVCYDVRKWFCTHANTHWSWRWYPQKHKDTYSDIHKCEL